ncbi:MAG TPA: YafY family protein [Roseiflexaceae bacterium]|nr:YafY family protein [Roseiflexaceae bacterium]
MYNPTTRLLTILELLQTAPVRSGPELAQRLEVEPRSVRRYITMLQDMGMPVEAVRGPGGGYRLRPGFKLPPLMFTEEEATAVVLGLLGSAWLAVGQSPAALEGALAKVLRVLPLRARERVGAMVSSLVVSSDDGDGRPPAALLLDLSEAVQQRWQVTIDYRSSQGAPTRRTVEPYGLAAWWGGWYLVAFCRMRGDFRLFRLDRIQRAEVEVESFERDEAFDVAAYLHDKLTQATTSRPLRVEFHAPPEVVRQRIPPAYGSLSATPAGTLFEAEYGDLRQVARFLVGRNLPFVALDPPELRAELRGMAEEIVRSAGGGL